MGERFLFAPFEMMGLGGVGHHRQFLTLLGSLGGLVLEAGPGELMEEGVHLFWCGGFLVTEPPIEEGHEGAGEGVSASSASDRVHGFCGGHRGEASLDAASEVTFP